MWLEQAQVWLHGQVELINHSMLSFIAFVIMVMLFALIVLPRGICSVLSGSDQGWVKIGQD